MFLSNNTSSCPYTRFTDMDIFLFKSGNHFELFEKLGSHLTEWEGVKGTYFALWAPNAESVFVTGDFNGWNHYSHPLYVRWDGSGIWEGFIPFVKHGDIYKYVIISSQNHMELHKADPFAFHFETPPKTASIVWDLHHDWKEGNWEKKKVKKNHLSSPMSIYEMHLGSWKRKEENQFLTYQDMAHTLPSYLKEMGFTHVEFMPVMEHPFYGSWGYQKVGFFAATSRYGTPQDFMHLIESLHAAGIGIYLDWVPSHFPSDEHALGFFDGTALYEHADPKKGIHPDWNSLVFNYNRHEVRSFLISSAIFWLQKFHVDGLRVDAVSSMLYLDYSRKEGEWVPNSHGGHENLEAISFIKQLNEYVYDKFPHIQMIAEESTAWPMVSKPTSIGGLGFGLKWDMGWMHDTLQYFSKDSIHRKYHHNDLLFNMYYFYNENFLLSLSHDEVVHGKGSLLGKMSGDDWQKFANLRLLYSYMFTHPGKKLLFMGSEIGAWNEWHHDYSLDWHLLQYSPHQGIQQLVKDLNHLYTKDPALYELDFDPNGFEWVNMHDSDNSVIAYLRKSNSEASQLLIVCNFTPTPRHDYSLGLYQDGSWKELFNSDSNYYGGSNMLTTPLASTTKQEMGFHPYKITLQLPPLATLILKKTS